MSDDLLVHHAELSYLRDEAHYLVVLGVGELLGDDLPEGAVALTAGLVAAEVFETRAAEYGIDPESKNGWDDLLHLVLGPQNITKDIENELSDPDHLFNAPTIAHARNAALGRIREAMGGRRLRGVSGVSEHQLQINEATRIAHSDAEDPLEFIKRTAPMSPDHIAVKAENVRRIRNQFKARRLGLDINRAYSPQELEQHEKTRAMKKAPARESADALAIRLLGAPLSEERSDRLPPRLGSPSKFL